MCLPVGWHYKTVGRNEFWWGWWGTHSYFACVTRHQLEPTSQLVHAFNKMNKRADITDFQFQMLEKRIKSMLDAPSGPRSGKLIYYVSSLQRWRCRFAVVPAKLQSSSFRVLVSRLQAFIQGPYRCLVRLPHNTPRSMQATTLRHNLFINTTPWHGWLQGRMDDEDGREDRWMSAKVEVFHDDVSIACTCRSALTTAAAPFSLVAQRALCAYTHSALIGLALHVCLCRGIFLMRSTSKLQKVLPWKWRGSPCMQIWTCVVSRRSCSSTSLAITTPTGPRHRHNTCSCFAQPICPLHGMSRSWQL